MNKVFISLDDLGKDFHCEIEVLKSHLDASGNTIIDKCDLKSISLDGNKIIYLKHRNEDCI